MVEKETLCAPDSFFSVLPEKKEPAAPGGRKKRAPAGLMRSFATPSAGHFASGSRRCPDRELRLRLQPFEPPRRWGAAELDNRPDSTALAAAERGAGMGNNDLPGGDLRTDRRLPFCTGGSGALPWDFLWRTTPFLWSQRNGVGKTVSLVSLVPSPPRCAHRGILPRRGRNRRKTPQTGIKKAPGRASQGSKKPAAAGENGHKKS